MVRAATCVCRSKILNAEDAECAEEGEKIDTEGTEEERRTQRKTQSESAGLRDGAGLRQRCRPQDDGAVSRRAPQLMMASLNGRAK